LCVFIAAALLLCLSGRSGLAASPLTWSRSLAELGYEQPVTAQGLEGDLDFVWTVPEAARGGTGRVALKLDALLTAGFSGTLTLSANGRPLQSQALGTGRTLLSLALGLDPALLESGTIHVGLHFAAAASGDACRDARLGGLSLAVDPASALALSLPADARKTAEETRSLLPGTIAVARPDLVAAGDYKKALVALAALIAEGHRVIITPDQHADIRLDPGTATPHLAEGILLLPLAGTPHKARAETIDHIALASFEGASGVRTANPAALWTVSLPSAALPRGKIPAGLALSLTSDAAAQSAPRIVQLFVNGTPAASQELRQTADAESLTLAVPPGLTRLDNTLSIRVMRAGPCASAQAPLDIALDPRSTLILADAPRQTGEFQDVARAGEAGLTIYLPTDELKSAQALPLLAGLLADYGMTDESALDVLIEGEAPLRPGRAFVLLGAMPPPDAQMALKAGSAVGTLRTRDGRPVATLDPAAGGFAALTTIGDQEGIWLVPARDLKGDAAPQGRLALEHGNVALIDDRGVFFWTNTKAPHGLSVSYAAADVIGPAIRRAWPFGVTLLWTGFSLIVLLVLARQALRK
jgi:hypothetical protein